MVANVAFLAALTTFLAVAWLAGELSFLAPFKAGIFRNHGVTIGVTITVLFLNLFAAFMLLCSMAKDRWTRRKGKGTRDKGETTAGRGSATGLSSGVAEEPRSVRPLALAFPGSGTPTGRG